MRRIIAAIIACTLMFSLAACLGGSEGEPEGEGAGENGSASTDEGFRVGFGEADITPRFSVPMGGYGDTFDRWSKGFKEYLMTMCVAVTDEDNNTVLLLTNDLTNIQVAEMAGFKAAITAATGIPEDHIVISATHTHSAPYYKEGTGYSAVDDYRELLTERMAEAALAAMEDRQSARMYIASVETENMNFVRRYVMNDGSFAGDNYGVTDSGYAGHESEADSVLQLLKFQREDAKDIILTNFQAHPHRNAKDHYYEMSSNIPGVYRDALAEALDCHVAYWTGAAGNLNFFSRIAEENETADYREQGNALAEYALEAEDKYVEVSTGAVKVSRQVFTGTVRKEPGLVPLAEKALGIYKATGRWAGTASEAAEGKITGAFQAQAVLRNAGLGSTYDFGICGVSFGDVAIAAAACEMFCDLGVYIKTNAPYKMTFVLTTTEGGSCYVATELGYRNGGYEPETSMFVSGTGELLAQSLVDLLADMKGDN